MMILDRYIGQALVRNTLLVALILLPLFTLLDLIQQLDDIGTGNYGLVDALIYEVFLMPHYLLSLVPFTRYEHKVLRPGLSDCPGDCSGSVLYDRRRVHAGLARNDHGNDFIGGLVARIVARHDDVICIALGNVSHLTSLALVAVTTAAENTPELTFTMRS